MKIAVEDNDVFACQLELAETTNMVKSVSLRTVLVYSGELARSIEAEGYFNAAIPFSRLIGVRCAVT